MNESALICTGLTAATLISLFCGSGLFLVFGFVLFWQILGALGDPDNPNKKPPALGTPMAKSNNWIRNLQGDYNICQKKILPQKLKNLLTM